MLRSFDRLIETRLSLLGYRSVERGGGGDCFYHCIAAETGMSMEELRHGLSQHMRNNEHIYGWLGGFAECGGVGICGVYVEENAEHAAMTDFISRNILV